MKSISIITQLLFFILMVCISNCEIMILNKENYASLSTMNTPYLISIGNLQIEKSKNVTQVLRDLEVLCVASKLDIKLVYLDIVEQKEIAGEWLVTKIPSHFFINNEDGNHDSYLGWTDQKQILKFIQNKIFLPVQYLDSIDTFDKYRKEHKSIVYVTKKEKFDPNDQNNLFRKAAKFLGFKYFFYTDTKEFLELFNMTIEETDLILLNRTREYDSKIQNFERLYINENVTNPNNYTEIKRYIEAMQREPFSVINIKNYEKMIEEGEPTVVLIYDKTAKTFGRMKSVLIDKMRLLALKYRKDINFVHGTFSDAEILTEYFWLDDESGDYKVPFLIITQAGDSTDDIDKYILNKEITIENVEQFINDFKAGKLEKDLFVEYNDEELEAVDYDRTKIDVKSFKNELMVNNKMIITNAYNITNAIDWAINQGKEVVLLICPKVSKKYNRIKTRLERVIDKLKRNKQIYFLVVDPIMNELVNIEYKFIPSVMHIKKNINFYENENKYIFTDHTKELTTEKITEFITNNSNFKLNVQKLERENIVNEFEHKFKLSRMRKQHFEDKIYELKYDRVATKGGLKRFWKSNDDRSYEQILELVTGETSANDIETKIKEFEKSDNVDESAFSDRKTEL